jgi:hypothetical protein
MATVVILYKNRFDQVEGSKFVDSMSMSGAVRKAKGLLRETFYVIVKKSRLDNYEYWDCKDIADVPTETERAYRIANEELLQETVDATPYLIGG